MVVSERYRNRTFEKHAFLIHLQRRMRGSHLLLSNQVQLVHVFYFEILSLRPVYSQQFVERLPELMRVSQAYNLIQRGGVGGGGRRRSYKTERFNIVTHYPSRQTGNAYACLLTA